jgi:chromosomal replication initiator protein
VVDPSPKQLFVEKKLEELNTSPAWAGQVTSMPLSFSEDGATKLTLQVRSPFVRDWLRENFLPGLQKELDALPGDAFTIQISVAAPAPSSVVSENVSAKTSYEDFKSPVLPISDEPKEEMEVIAEKIEKTVPRKITHESLKPKSTFESFVIGSSNQFAHAAAIAVAKLPGKNYNPLFIYGGVGLGKTHLLNAIGIEILKRDPTAKVIFTSSEKFMNELIYCMRFDKMVEFRRKYRDRCDVMLIDDIQFIAGKERTQEEFFHTFNHLYDLQKQIVLTSDKSPREIPDLEERLKSRFEWGLQADIQVPDLETRIAILRKKAEDDGIPLEDELGLFLASNIKSNVRELEGSLIRLNALATLNKVPLTMGLAREGLKNILGDMDRVLTVEQIQKVVADYYKIRLADLTGKRRMRSFALPRQIAMYLCRKHVRSSYPEIGYKFGGKDHSTVVHAFSKIQKDIPADKALQNHIGNLEQALFR